MIGFLWHLRGSVALEPDADKAAVLDRLEAMLLRQRKTVIRHSPDELSFDNPLWSDPFGPNWLAMVVFERGDFQVGRHSEGQTLRYDLRCLHVLVVCLCIALFLVVTISAREGPLTGTKVAALAFAWLYGGNRILAWLRVPGLIRRTALDR